MNGSGAVTIATSNSYTGGTTINAGRLNFANSAALGGPTTASVYGAFTINGGSVNNTSSSGALTLPNYPIAWNAGFVFPGSNPLNLGTGAVTLGNSAAVTLSGSTLTLGGAIGDSGSGYGFAQNGAGVLALLGSSTYSGQTTVNGGTLTLGNGASINGTSGVNLAAANSVLVFSHTDSRSSSRPSADRAVWSKRAAAWSRSPPATRTRAVRRLPAARLPWAIRLPCRTAPSTSAAAGS